MKIKSDMHKYAEASVLLDSFSREMGRQLAKNMYKDGWQECSTDFLLNKIRRHLITLENSDDPNEIIRISANIANYCAMYSDNFKKK